MSVEHESNTNKTEPMTVQILHVPFRVVRSYNCMFRYSVMFINSNIYSSIKTKPLIDKFNQALVWAVL